MCSNVWDPKNTGSSSGCQWHNNSDLLKTTSSTVSYSLYELFIWLEAVKKLFFLGSSGGFFVMSFIHITRVTYIYRFFGCAFSVFCQSSEAELHTICERSRWVCGQVENKYYFASLSLFSCNCFRHRSPGHAGLVVYAKSFCFCRFVLTPTWR